MCMWSSWWRVDATAFSVQVCYRVEGCYMSAFVLRPFWHSLLINGCGVSSSCCASLPLNCHCVWSARVARESTWFIMQNMFWQIEILKTLDYNKYNVLVQNIDAEGNSSAIPHQQAKNMPAKTGKVPPYVRNELKTKIKAGKMLKKHRCGSCLQEVLPNGPKLLADTVVCLHFVPCRLHKQGLRAKMPASCQKTAQNCPKRRGKICGCSFKLRTDVVVNVKSLSDENSSTAMKYHFTAMKSVLTAMKPNSEEKSFRDA